LDPNTAVVTGTGPRTRTLPSLCRNGLLDLDVNSLEVASEEEVETRRRAAAAAGDVAAIMRVMRGEDVLAGGVLCRRLGVPCECGVLAR